MAFWNDASSLEPKRSFTFLLTIAGKSQAIENYLIKNVTKPSPEVSKSEHKFLNHTFKYPGKVTWNDVEFEVVDVVDPNTSQVFMEMLQEAGYRRPEGPVEPGLPTAQTISKKRSLEALGEPTITQIDHDGNTVDEWTLKGAWISKVDFGKNEYEGEDLLSIKVTITYDYPVFNVIQPAAKELPETPALPPGA